ncbi:hypothetical protein ACOMHN_054557 [Nucella lapillus]
MASKGQNGETLRVVLLGKTGAGKSSLGNSLTGNKPPKAAPSQQRDERPPTHSNPNEGFKIGRGLKSETVFCDWSQADRHGTVTDTPGLCDTHLDEEKIYKEVAKSVAVAKPGPNVIIFTLRCDRRFTDEEYKAYQKIKELFSEEMNKHLILVFNGLDCYDDLDTVAEQREMLREEITKFGDKLNDMVSQAGNRIFGMNNKASDEEKNQQTKDLIDMMKTMVEKNGRDVYYRTEMSDQIMKKVEKMVEKEAAAKGVSKAQATTELKTKIITEAVQPSFLQSIMNPVVTFANRVTEGVSDMCSVM